MRGNLQTIIHSSNLIVDMPEALEDATILYEWGTKVAKRRFCKSCGILPWYQPRSNPDGVGITVNCVDWTKGGAREAPKVTIQDFDGVHWEESMAKLKPEAKKAVPPRKQS